MEPQPKSPWNESLCFGIVSFAGLNSCTCQCFMVWQSPPDRNSKPRNCPVNGRASFGASQYWGEFKRTIGTMYRYVQYLSNKAAKFGPPSAGNQWGNSHATSKGFGKASCSPPTNAAPGSVSKFLLLRTGLLYPSKADIKQQHQKQHGLGRVCKNFAQSKSGVPKTISLGMIYIAPKMPKFCCLSWGSATWVASKAEGSWKPSDSCCRCSRNCSTRVFDSSCVSDICCLGRVTELFYIIQFLNQDF